MPKKDNISIKEKRIRDITKLYYSKREVQKAIFEFAKGREISPRYYEGFGKRPDTFQYIGDVYQMVKKGATSFHCSEELWEDPLKIETGMPKETLNEIRKGWDLVIDIDCKYFDYAKIATKAVLDVLESHKIKNYGLKVSGSKGFHILVPWKAFPKEIAGEETKNLFPDLPRKIVGYIRFKAEKEIRKYLPKDFEEQFKGTKVKKGFKCKTCKEVAFPFLLVTHQCPNCLREETRKVIKKEKVYDCPLCRRPFIIKDEEEGLECKNCDITSLEDKTHFSEDIEVDLFDLMGLDLVLVSPRHLFRMPLSLHEKTALVSVVITKEEIDTFHPKDADPLKVKIKNFMPESQENEAKELVTKALDWSKVHAPSNTSYEPGQKRTFETVKIEHLKEDYFPPCVKKILEGITDGRKRAVFALINFFRSLGREEEDVTKRLFEWNKKLKSPLKEGYLASQIKWAFKKNSILPPNCREFYEGIGVCHPDQMCSKIKNPVNYVVRKNFGVRKSKKR